MARPKIELSDEHIELIERLASFGLTQAQIADCLPLSERTLSGRIRSGEDEAVSAAYARGRAKDAETLSSRHRDIALGRFDQVPVSEQRKALEWRLERQHKWASQHEVAGEGGGPIRVEVVHTVVDPSGGEDPA